MIEAHLLGGGCVCSRNSSRCVCVFGALVCRLLFVQIGEADKSRAIQCVCARSLPRKWGILGHVVSFFFFFMSFSAFISPPGVCELQEFWNFGNFQCLVSVCIVGQRSGDQGVGSDHMFETGTHKKNTRVWRSSGWWRWEGLSLSVWALRGGNFWLRSSTSQLTTCASTLLMPGGGVLDSSSRLSTDTRRWGRWHIYESTSTAGSNSLIMGIIFHDLTCYFKHSSVTFKYQQSLQGNYNTERTVAGQQQAG